MPTLEAHFTHARQDLLNFLSPAPRDAKLLAFHDVDADGIAAGVIWQRTMERAGFHPQRAMPGRQRNAWLPENRARLQDLAPQYLFVLDLGCQSKSPLPGVPTCFIDHHRPEGVPPGDLLISGYPWDPIPNTSWMMWELAAGLADVTDLDWIAVIGTLSDLGDNAPWPLVAAAKKKYTAKYLREATTLVNAPRRASHFNPEAAARALLEHAGPKELVLSDSPDVQALKTARQEVAAALAEGKKAAPHFAGEVALVRVNSPCQIHPLIAQIWRSRLPKYFVICANPGYIPGQVSFSARAAPSKNVLEFLRSFHALEGEEDFGHGHDQASGGSIPTPRWNKLMEQMGFSKEMQF